MSARSIANSREHRPRRREALRRCRPTGVAPTALRRDDLRSQITAPTAAAVRATRSTPTWPRTAFISGAAARVTKTCSTGLTSIEPFGAGPLSGTSLCTGTCGRRGSGPTRRSCLRSARPEPPGCSAGRAEAVARLDDRLAHPARLDREVHSGMSAWIVPGTTRPSRRNVGRPERRALRHGLVHRLEVVERVRESFYEQESEGATSTTPATIRRTLRFFLRDEGTGRPSVLSAVAGPRCRRHLTGSRRPTTGRAGVERLVRHVDRSSPEVILVALAL